MKITNIRTAALAAATALLLAPAAYAGEKLDSGLGELPHYSQWSKHPELKKLVVRTTQVAGEKLDSGLGELPHYSQWADVKNPQRIDVAGR